ncbi:MAG TPA: PP2C family serine/threonine-protein phosphatase [Anaerolineae bacterium]|nr:PP2C family serine/threonine-protein phosphatase [Anaerolineae bacterium]
MHSAIKASLQTDQGQVRSRNEDAIAHWEPTTPELAEQYGWLYVVADGVGGADAGDVASRYAADKMVEHYTQSDPSIPIETRLREAVQAANKDLRQLVKDKGDGTRMATTMVASVLHGNLLYIANVGDSRGYLWRKGGLRQITRDQSLVAKLVEEGAITPEEALRHPHRNVILSSLGGEDRPQIEIFVEPVQSGDRVLLCSDGLTRYLGDEELNGLMGEDALDEITKTFVAEANERGGADNISTIVIEVETTGKGGGRVDITETTPNLRLYTTFLAVVEVVLIMTCWWQLRI